MHSRSYTTPACDNKSSYKEAQLLDDRLDYSMLAKITNDPFAGHHTLGWLINRAMASLYEYCGLLYITFHFNLWNQKWLSLLINGTRRDPHDQLEGKLLLGHDVSVTL